MNLSSSDLGQALLAGCRRQGASWGEEAAVHLLVAQGTWLRRDREFRRHISTTTDEQGTSAWADWAAIAKEPDRSPASSGERAVLRLACHLAGYVPDQGADQQWSLAEILYPLDATNAMLAGRAVAMAALGPDIVGPLQPS